MKNQTRTLVIGIIAIGFALAGGLLARNTFRKGVDMVGYAVPNVDIQPYTVLSTDMFTSRELPRALSESGAEYCPDVRDLVGRMTTSRLVANLPVACAVISESQDYRLADPSLEVASFAVPSANAVGGDIEAGTNINVYLIRTYSSDSNSTSRSDSSLIATVPVMKTLPGAKVEGEEDKIIIVVAAASKTVQAIVGAVAKDKGDDNASLWITLAAADSAVAGSNNVSDMPANSQSLGISRADTQSSLEQLGFVFGSVQDESTNPVVAGTRGDVAESSLFGPAEELTKVVIRVKAVDGESKLLENSVYMVGFVKFVFPDWSQGVTWVSNQFTIATAGAGAQETYAGINIIMSPVDADGFVTMEVSR